MVVARVKQTQKAKTYPIGTRPSKAGYFPAAYETGKTILRGYGVYQDVKPYLPETYIDKYTYKPHKRVAGYAGQIFWSKKELSKANVNCDIYQKRNGFCFGNY